MLKLTRVGSLKNFLYFLGIVMNPYKVEYADGQEEYIVLLYLQEINFPLSLTLMSYEEAQKARAQKHIFRQFHKIMN